MLIIMGLAIGAGLLRLAYTKDWLVYKALWCLRPVDFDVTHLGLSN